MTSFPPRLSGLRAASRASPASRRGLVGGSARDTTPALTREVKFAGAPLSKVEADGAFEGYASLFGIVDLGQDLVEPGAFKESVTRRGARGVKLLWSHDPGEPIGLWEAISEDLIGLKVRGRLNLDVARAREVHALMKTGAVDGLSIGFKAERSRRDPQTGVRRLMRVDLWEVSLVTFPMLPQARVSAVKRASSPGLARAIAAAARLFDGKDQARP
jgi:uncharacterized protein